MNELACVEMQSEYPHKKYSACNEIDVLHIGGITIMIRSKRFQQHTTIIMAEICQAGKYDFIIESLMIFQQHTFLQICLK